MKAAAAALLVSACLHMACFLRWPGNPDWDVCYSVYAAQNFLSGHGLRSFNLFPDPTDDVARHAQIRWMTQWPPAQSWTYLAVMGSGLKPGSATKVLAFLCILVGGLGWLFLAGKLGATRLTLVAIAAAYPWLSFLVRSYLDYKNDHLACAIAPWVYLLVLRIEPLHLTPIERWGRLAIAALMAGSTVLVKYSLSPVIIGSGLYLLWVDGWERSPKRIARVGVFGALLALPPMLLWFINHIRGGNQYPLLGGGLPFRPLNFAINLVEHAFGSANGWELVVIQANLGAEKWFHHYLFHGAIFIICFPVLLLWVWFFARGNWKENEKRFLVYLGLLTGSLCATLILTTVSSPIGYDFTSDGRFAMPITFGWLALMAVALGKTQSRSLVRSATLLSLILPVAFSAAFFAHQALFETPYLQLARSRLMWSETADPTHVVFLAGLRKPDLIVPPDGRFFVEFDAPAYFPFFPKTRNDRHVYYSSRNLEGLAILKPENAQIFLDKFRRAASLKQIDTPAGFPYIVYEFQFQPLRLRASPPSLYLGSLATFPTFA